MNAIIDRYRCPGDLFNEFEPGFPLDPTQAVEDLRLERYVPAAAHGLAAAGASSPSIRFYNYFVRPWLPARLRLSLQRIYFQDWDRISFPQWPLDVSVENLLEKSLLLRMKADGLDAIPFIWFWPDGAPGAAIVTHDVETSVGRDFCGRLMDIDADFGVPSAFQIVPESRYRIPPGFLEEIRRRGHEINIHDFNHDGCLFADRNHFRSRVKLINQYGRDFGARGFRAAILYRNTEWLTELEFEYDMSVPNLGHLEAQRGGCCTVFPYFIGNILELPLTTTQDYSLFYILQSYNLDLWKSQAEGILAKHGLLSCIVHPDYLQEARARQTYRGLLAFLTRSRTEQGVWITTPGAVNTWWRQRSQMELVSHRGVWRIEGPGQERARVAYARADGDRIVYSLDEPTPLCSTRLNRTGYHR